VQVVFSHKYFDLLPPTDQAMLLMHESLYVLGQAIGHATSDIIRGFTRIFFLQSWQNSRFHGQPYLIDLATQGIKTRLVEFFGDYIKYFSKSHTPAEGAPFTSQHHFYTFFNLVQRLRSRMAQCIAKGMMPNVCKEQIMNPRALSNELSPEEAFLYLADFGLEQAVGGFNADYLMNPATQDQSAVHSAMDFACRRIQDLFDTQPFPTQALSYCADWRANYSTQRNKSN
jgi:hypothetical protein